MQTAIVLEPLRAIDLMFEAPEAPSRPMSIPSAIDALARVDTGTGDAIGFACAALEGLGGSLPAVRFVDADTVVGSAESVTVGRDVAARLTPLALAQAVATEVADATELESALDAVLQGLVAMDLLDTWDIEGLVIGDVVSALVAGLFAFEPATSELAWRPFDETGSLERTLRIDIVATAISRAVEIASGGSR